MNAMVAKALEMAKKSGYFALQYAHVVLAWGTKSVKVQLQRMKKAGEQKKVAKAWSGLGAEIYALHKQVDGPDWKTAETVQQQLKMVEEAENTVFQVDTAIDELNSAYAARKQELKDKYAAKRQEAAAAGDSEESEG